MSEVVLTGVLVLMSAFFALVIVWASVVLWGQIVSRIAVARYGRQLMLDAARLRAIRQAGPDELVPANLRARDEADRLDKLPDAERERLQR